MLFRVSTSQNSVVTVLKHTVLGRYQAVTHLQHVGILPEPLFNSYHPHKLRTSLESGLGAEKAWIFSAFEVFEVSKDVFASAKQHGFTFPLLLHVACITPEAF